MDASPVFDFFAQVNEHLTAPPKRKSLLENYFQAHLEFQGRYIEPSPTPEPSIASAVNSSLKRTIDDSSASDNEYEYPRVEYSMPKKRRLSAYAVMRSRLAAGARSPSLGRHFSGGLSVPSTPGSGGGGGAKKRKRDVFSGSEVKARKLSRSHSFSTILSSPSKSHEAAVLSKPNIQSKNKRRQPWGKTTDLPALVRKLSRRCSSVEKKAVKRGGYSLRRTPARTKIPGKTAARRRKS